APPRTWVGPPRVLPPRPPGDRAGGRPGGGPPPPAARSVEGIDAIRLTCRGGLGLEHFYSSCGYKEVGRVPGAVRVAPGDDRDDITMLLPLY
ncbi:GNAT family N-acetyltransferase, partial [Streptomyces virginiae]